MGSEDAVERVAVQIGEALDDVGLTGEAITIAAQAAIDAHTAYLVEQGGVTDDDIEAAAEGTVERSVIAVRALVARAVATATAEKVAENERLRATIARVEAVCDKWDNGPDSADYVNVDAIRAAIADENGDTA